MILKWEWVLGNEAAISLDESMVLITVLCLMKDFEKGASLADL